MNLVFKQLLFDLEAEVFGYFKDWAASTTLDKMFKRVFEARRGWGHFIPGRRRYEVYFPLLELLLELVSRYRWDSTILGLHHVFFLSYVMWLLGGCRDRICLLLMKSVVHAAVSGLDESVPAVMSFPMFYRTVGAARCLPLYGRLRCSSGTYSCLVDRWT